MKKIILSIIALSASPVLFAQNAAEANIGEGYYDIILWILIAIAVIVLIITFSLLNSINELKNKIAGDSGSEHAKLSLWEKLLSLKPLTMEKDMDMGHEYDGIRELNNSVPIWFNVLFYGLIVTGIVYLFTYHVFNIMPLQAQEYKNEMAAAQIQKEAYLKTSGNAIDENTVKQITDAAKLEGGKKIFVERCQVCHGEHAEGKVGPNLTDEFWIHGGTINAIFKTIKEGVPAKGMVSWKNVLKPDEMQLMASYVLSLQGTKPANPKDPQGDKMVSDTTKIQIDSLVKK